MTPDGLEALKALADMWDGEKYGWDLNGHQVARALRAIIIAEEERAKAPIRWVNSDGKVVAEAKAYVPKEVFEEGLKQADAKAYRPSEAKAEAGLAEAQSCECGLCFYDPEELVFHQRQADHGKKPIPDPVRPPSTREAKAEAGEGDAVLRVAAGLVLEAYSKYDLHSTTPMWGTKLDTYLDQLRRVVDGQWVATAHRGQTERLSQPAKAKTEVGEWNGAWICLECGKVDVSGSCVTTPDGKGRFYHKHGKTWGECYGEYVPHERRTRPASSDGLSGVKP